MSKKELAQKLAGDLKALAESIEAFLQDEPAAEAPTETSVELPAETPAEAPAESHPITIEEVRALLAAKSQSGKRPEVKALITKYGANKLTDIGPERFSDIYRDAEGL